MGICYFGVSPLVSINQLRLGPVTILNLTGVAAILSGIFLAKGRRVLNNSVWSVTSACLFSVLLVGLWRSPGTGGTTALQFLIRFLVSWLVVSLTPLRRKISVHYGVAWVVGLCVAGALQTYNENRSGVYIDETGDRSYSSYIQGNELYDLGTELNIYDTYGYMAMAITGVCCIGLALTAIEGKKRALFGLSGIFLISAERRGGFLSADLLVAVGLVMTVVLVLATYGKRGVKWVVISVALCALVFARLAPIMNYSNIEARIGNIANAGLSGDGSALERMGADYVSLNTWLAHFVFGVGLVGFDYDSDQYIGGHSSIVDIPAQIGAVGLCVYYGYVFVPLLLTLRCLRSGSRLRPDAQRCALVVVVGLTLFLIGTAINPTFLRSLLDETMLLLLFLAATVYSGVRRRAEGLTIQTEKTAQRRDGYA
jgi:hypothetical protein